MVIAGFRSGRRRRQPYPLDIKLGGMGRMLLDDRTGPSFRTKQLAPLEKVQPTEYGYSSVNPEIESTLVYDDLADGLGLSDQESPRDRRYHYALGNDHSIAKENIKGPELTTIDPLSSSKGVLEHVTKFFELGDSLYAIVGRYILKRTGDAASEWIEAEDLGEGRVAIDVEVFHSNVSGGSELAFVATRTEAPLSAGEGSFYSSSDGSTWSAHGSLKAQALKKIGREFYRAHDTNMLAKVNTNTDPLTAGNWSGDNAFRVGDKTSSIIRLDVNAEGALMIFKTDGVYTLDAAGKDHKLFPQLQFAPDNTTRLEDARIASNIGHYLNDIYVGYGEGYYRITPDNSLEEVGPERFITGSAGIKGRITSFQGHAAFHAYAGLYDEDNNKSYLLKYGAWRGPERLTAWHGSITAAFTPSEAGSSTNFPNGEIRSLFKSAIGAESGHTRLYIGYGDGQIAWFTLPCVADPSDCSKYTFTTANTETYLPRFTGQFAADNKVMRAVTVTGSNLDGTDYAQVEYRIDSLGAYIAFGRDFKEAPRERKDFSSVTVGTFFDPKLILINSVNTRTPKVRGMALHYNVRSTQIFNYEFSILAEDGLFRLDNVPLRVGADRIRFHLKTSARAFSSVQIITPDEQTETINIKGYQEEQFWDERLKQYRAIVNIGAVTESTAYGSYTQLEKYTFGELEDMSFGSMKLL